MIRLGVTGTDTGVGKTVVSCALAARARQLSQRVAVIKPVESGVDANDPDSDTARLQSASASTDDIALIRPYLFAEPLAPMVAAARENVTIDLQRLDDAVDALVVDRDVLLVEGAGGLLVPYTSSIAFVDLCQRWQCELVVVAANRLGVLNHTRLTLRAAAEASVQVRAVVLVSTEEHERSVAQATNFATLQSLVGEIELFRFPWVAHIDSHDALAHAAERAGMDSLLLP